MPHKDIKNISSLADSPKLKPGKKVDKNLHKLKPSKERCKKKKLIVEKPLK
jgi:hypothetical protein